MRILTRNAVKISAVILLTFCLFAGCEKDKENKLQLPPESAFVMDLSAFNGDQKSVLVASDINTRNAFAIAATTVGFWNLILAGVMYVPTVSYIKAFDYQPVRQANNKWLWSYTVDGLLYTYTAKLYGEVVGDHINWEMYLTKSGVYEDFLWYEGVCNTERTEGTWTLYAENPDVQTKAMDIEWTYNWEQKTGSLKYIYALPDNNEGNYIEYGITDNTDFNAYYDLHSIPQNTSWHILYNTTTEEGSISVISTGGTEKYCWDSNHDDIVCPE